MNRIALVTGGTRGIGAAISRLFKQSGYRVITNYKSDEQEAKAFSDNTGIPVIKWDVSDYDECIKHIAEIEKKFQGHVEIVVNNAGITRDGMFHKSEPKQWYDVINTNLNSCYNVSRAVIEKMRENKFGRIINISSINALSGQVGQTNYTASKAGIIGFTKALALESASKNITVNAIAPGYTDTEMVRVMSPEVLEKIIQKIPVGRLGTPEEIARVAGFLASDEAGFITGITLSVNGGLYMQ
ncbi:MAG: acetoacetyl-CoA reductase [Rickettsiales bacterium]|nr:acetoacetyl-CoA reductase [Rickettsiales bacterium]